MLAKRSAKILEKLALSGQPVSVTELAGGLDVSVRSIQHDIKNIEEYLRENGYPPIIRGGGGTVQLCLAGEVRARLLKGLGSIDYSYVLSPLQRQKSILAFLLAAEGYLTIEQLAKRMLVSRATVASDIKAARQLLRPYALELQSRPNFGIQLVGEEKELRRLAISLVQAEAAGPVADSAEYDRIAFGLLLQGMSPRPIEDAIGFAQEELHMRLPAPSAQSLKAHLALAVRRAALGRYMPLEKPDFSRLSQTREFSAARGMLRVLQEGYGVVMPPEEAAYITIYLLDGRSEPVAGDALANLEILAQSLIADMCRQMPGAFLVDDALVWGLVKHLDAAVYRLRYGVAPGPLYAKAGRGICCNYAGRLSRRPFASAICPGAGAPRGGCPFGGAFCRCPRA